LVTADTDVLSDYYGGAAEIVAPVETTLRRACAARSRTDDASERMAELRTRRNSRATSFAGCAS